MTIALSFNSGNEATVAKPSSTFRSRSAMPSRTWPSTNDGSPLAWNETKSIDVPVSPGAWFFPRS